MKTMKTANQSPITGPFPPGSPRSERGYSLIEFVGVLAITAILAAMLVPVVINQTETQAVNTEISNLNNMNGAFTLGVLRTYQIPGATTWASSLGSWLTLPSSSIATNAHGYSRIYVYDTNGFGGVSLPYAQSNGISALPANPRLMIVSSLSANPPDSSGGLSSNEFSAIWNTPVGSVPSTWTSWSGSGSDLIIQRINLEPLFHRLVLSAIDTNVFGNYTVQSGTTITPSIYVLTNSPVNNWYIQGTVIGLADTNAGASSPNIESKVVMQGDTCYVFENEAWRGQLSGWGTNGPAGISLTSVVSSASVTVSQGVVTTGKSFETCALNPNDYGGTSRGDSCEALYGSFHTFMMDYNNWSKERFGAGSDNACIRLLNDDQNSIYNLTQNMCQ